MKKAIADLKFKRRGLTSSVKSYMNSLKSYGQQTAVVIDTDSKVLFNVGHELCQAAKNLGWTEVEVSTNPEAVKVEAIKGGQAFKVVGVDALCYRVQKATPFGIHGEGITSEHVLIVDESHNVYAVAPTMTVVLVKTRKKAARKPAVKS